MSKEYISSTSRRFIRLHGKAGLSLSKRPFLYSAASFSLVGVIVVALQLFGVINFATRPVYADAINTTDFVTTWKTNAVSGSDSSITVTTSGAGYNYDVDWNNDGTFDQTGITGNVTHNFGTPGTYTIRIRGSFPSIVFANNANAKKIIDVNQWGNNPWKTMRSAFSYTTNLHSFSATDSPDLSNVTDMSYMFFSSSFDGNIGNWDTSNIQDMYSMFDNNTVFNKPLNTWNTSSVRDMDNMFAKASSFNQPLNNWNTSNVEYFYGMFSDASAFNQPLTTWNTIKATDMSGMFQGATSFNQSLNGWNTSNVTDMSHMFDSATSFNGQISNWNTSNVKDMTWMFNDASSFNQPIGGWNTSSVTNTIRMFSGASAFNQPLNQWNTVNLSSSAAMFDQASSFNQPLGSWNMSQQRYLWNMLSGTALSRENYDATLQGWASQSLSWAELGADGLEYCLGDEAHDILVKQYGWTITGDTYNCNNGPASSTDDFVTTWKTDGSGDPDDASLTIYTDSDVSYSYSVDWDNDGVFDESNLTGDATHTYNTAGTYTVRIRGKFPKFWLGYNENPSKLIDVKQWGSMRWRDMENSFAYATNLHSFSAIDKPDLSRATSMMNMFQGSSFNGAIGDWDVSHVSNMSGIFSSASFFNQPLGGLDVKGVTDMEGMLDNSGLSQTNYDATLQGWANQSLQSDVNLGAFSLKYCLGEVARQTLSNNFNWNISGDSKDCTRLPKETTAKVNGTPMTRGILLAISNRPTFSGTSVPGAQIVVTVHSDPVTCSTIAASDGTWSCRLPTTLPGGQHTVIVNITYPDSSTEQLGPYAISVGEEVTNNTPLAPSTGAAWQSMMVQAHGVVVALLIILICCVVRFLGYTVKIHKH